MEGMLNQTFLEAVSPPAAACPKFGCKPQCRTSFNRVRTKSQILFICKSLLPQG